MLRSPAVILLAAVWCASAAAQPEAIVVRVAASGFTQPVAAVADPAGDGSLLIVEQRGRILRMDPSGTVSATPWLDLSEATGIGVTCIRGERGLLGLTFHPDFATNGFAFLNYTSPTSGCSADGDGIPDFDTVIARITVVAGMPEPGTLVEILRIPQPYGNHNAGDLEFGPDGLLYIGTGDGGSAGDPLDTAQDVGDLLGKMLRIDVDATGADQAGACGGVANYGIPAGNPDLGPNSCPEIWALGLRNPYRYSFDSSTGDLWIGDVGQNAEEEISRVGQDDVGANLGWDCREGNRVYDEDPGDPGTASVECALLGDQDLLPPVLTYGHQAGRCSVTGGFVYRGPETMLDGQYIGGDFCTGEFFLATDSGDGWDGLFQPELRGGNLSGFGEGADGSLFAVDYGGRILELLAERMIEDSFE